MPSDFEIPVPTYRVPRRPEPGMRRLALIAGGLGAALVALVAVWSLGGHRAGTVPVIEADSRPMRVKPANPGGLQVADQTEDDLLSKNPDAGDRSGKLAPAAEVPAPAALRAQEDAAARVSAHPAAAKPAPPPALAAEPTAPPPAQAAAPVKPASFAPVPAAASPAASHTVVQLAAMDSREQAQQEWTRLSRKMPGLLDGRHPAILSVARDGHELWRLRTGGFADEAAAKTFCDKVRAHGGACSVATF